MNRIPVSIITGFLGSGKTTLLNRILSQPDLSDAAVIINEFGEIGLDHELVQASDGEVVLLPNGCLCCAVKGDFVRTLDELHRRRMRGSVMRFSRVIVETSGMADPCPIILALLTEPSLHARYELDTVLATVDVINGEATLEAHLEAVKQIAVADRLVLTKQDMLPLETGDEALVSLSAQLRRLNRGAAIDSASAAIDEFFRTSTSGPAQKDFDSYTWLRTQEFMDVQDRLNGLKGAHSGRVRSFCVVRNDPIDEVALEMFLSALGKHLGPNLLRFKGIVNVAQQPGRPAIVHGVQTMLHQPAWLDCWPSEDRRTRLVFITLDAEQEEIEEMLNLMERMQTNAARARERAASLAAASSSDSLPQPLLSPIA